MIEEICWIASPRSNFGTSMPGLLKADTSAPSRLTTGPPAAGVSTGTRPRRSGFVFRNFVNALTSNTRMFPVSR